MNTDQLEGRWRQLRARILERWGKLTDDQLDQVRGRWGRLVGFIQEQYGGTREEVERQVKEFRRTHEPTDESQLGG